MSASIKKKSKLKSDKVATNNKQQTTNNKQTNNNKRPFFLPKINKVFLRPILQNLKGRSVLDNFFFENDPLDELNQMPLSKNSISSGSWSISQNSGQNRIYPSLTRPQNFSLLKRVLKNGRLLFVVCCCCLLLFVATLSDFGLLFF